MKHSVEEISLKNGAKGLIIYVPSAGVVNFDFNFRAGDYLSPKNKWDTAHIMEHMVLGANKTYASAADFSREFSRNGAYDNASTGTYHMSYIAECADFETLRILDLLCLAIESPLFLESEFKAEKANVAEELKSRSNNHSSELSLRLGQAMGQNDLSYQDRYKQLKNIDLLDILTHYKKTHTAKNLRFFIAGNIKKDKRALLKRIESINLTDGDKRLKLPTEKIRHIQEPIAIHNNTVDTVYYRWETSFEKLLEQAQDDAFEALLAILLSTMHSRIFGKARELGLAYGIGYDKYRTKQTNIWCLSGQVTPQNTLPLFKLFVAEFKSILEKGITKDELDEAKLRALGNYKRNNQTAHSVLELYTERFIFDDKVEDIAKFTERINGVSLDAVAEVAKSAFASSNPWGLAFYGQTSKIDPKSAHSLLGSLYI